MSLIRPLLTVLLVAALFACGQPSGSPPPQQPPAGSDPPAAEVLVSSRDLILADLKAGRIDHATSLLYRLYAQHGDSRLPEAYRGDGADPEDLGLFLEADRTLPTLPEVDQARLRPWLARPNDPISPHSAAAAASSAQRVRPTAAPPCVDGWATRRSLTSGFRAWVRCDAAAEADLETLLAMLDSVWGPAVALMGPPVMDEPDGGPNIDDAIDVYAIDRSEDPAGGRRIETLEGRTLAFARPVHPLVGKTSSGFMVVQRGSLSNGVRLRSDLVHEFFHVLQFGHNYEYFAPTCEPGNCPIHWFVEASAKWSESHLADDGAVRPTETYPWFRKFVTGAEEGRWGKEHATLHPLNASAPDRHKYAAHAWPLYMELARGAGSVAAAWDGIAGVASWEQADGAIDAQVSFASEFGRFALANYNRDEVAAALPRRYQSLLPDLPTWEQNNAFGAGHAHRELSGAITHSLPVEVPNLAAWYLTVLAHGAVQEVTVSLADVAGEFDMGVDALVKPRGGAWQLRSWTGQGEVRLCDVEEIVIVVTNRSPRAADAFSGAVGVAASVTPCEAVITGTWTQTADLAQTFSYGTETYTETLTLSNLRFERLAEDDPTIDSRYYRLVSATATWSAEGTSHRPADPCPNSSSKAGPVTVSLTAAPPGAATPLSGSVVVWGDPYGGFPRLEPAGSYEFFDRFYAQLGPVTSTVTHCSGTETSTASRSVSATLHGDFDPESGWAVSPASVPFFVLQDGGKMDGSFSFTASNSGASGSPRRETRDSWNLTLAAAP